ncbi:MAG: hypothetical protein IRZ02_01530 [Acidothermus sp.]|nr:hypothetical protein [Acidothermus sp.]MCL6537139.1 hypothetical protein [Acidothermus sp.]
MHATLLLCDAAQVDPSGKVHILGAGWTVVAAAPTGALPGQAVVVLVHVPWHRTDEEHRLRLRLEDADGRAVVVGPPENPQPLVHEQFLRVQRPVGAPAGITVDVPVVVTIGPGLVLPPGRYAWRLEIDGETQEDWMVSFHVRAPSAGAER